MLKWIYTQLGDKIGGKNQGFKQCANMCRNVNFCVGCFNKYVRKKVLNNYRILADGHKKRGSEASEH